MNSKENKITLSEGTSWFWKFWDWLVVSVAVFRSVEVPAIVALKFLQSAPPFGTHGQSHDLPPFAF